MGNDDFDFFSGDDDFFSDIENTESAGGGFDAGSDMDDFADFMDNGTSSNSGETPDISGRFSEQFDESAASQPVERERSKLLEKLSENKRVALIVAGVAFGFILLVIFIITRLGGKNENVQQQTQHVTQQQQVNQTQVNQTQVNQTQQEQSSVNAGVTGEEPQINNTKETNSDWKSISNNENITWSNDLETQTFTVTKVDSFARAVDASESLDVKTVVSGSISGYGGTYELELPYKLGSKLSRGSQFKVYVYTGDYKGRTVVGGIEYLQR